MAIKFYGSATLLTLLGILIGVQATAHHSPTYFDAETEIVHEDVTVVAYEVENPHGILIYVLTDDDGNEVEWNAELPSANFMRRGGLTNETLRPGDKLTAVIGSPGVPGWTRPNLIRLTRAEFPNGDVATFTGISAEFIPAAAD